jgi:hypothetical protein
MKNILIATILAAVLVGCGSSGASGSSDSSSAGSQSTGKGGSMARFAISGDYLYTLNQREMEVFYIAQPSTPQPQSKVHVNFDVETLYSYKDYLYIGSESGVYIYDASTPTQPTKVSQFTHTKSCDPVVVEDDIAYVTLRSGGVCRLDSGENTLQVLDIKDPLDIKLIKTLGMWNPSGLGIDENKLFICDGSAGLKVFDINKTDANETHQLTVDIQAKHSVDDVNCNDVIPFNKNLIVSDGNSVRQFDYSQFPMVELGKIK